MKFQVFKWVIEVKEKEEPPRPLEPTEKDLMYVELNNTYLDIEAGRIKLTKERWNRLYCLVKEVFPYEEGAIIQIQDYWIDELAKLPGANNV